MESSTTALRFTKGAPKKSVPDPVTVTVPGADQSASGFSTTFSDQLFFYVPEKGSSEPIRLLGYSSSILKGSVL